MRDKNTILNGKYRIIFLAVCTIFWPLAIFYVTIIYFPLLVIEWIRSSMHVALIFEVVCRKSELIRKLVIHLSVLYIVASNILDKMRNTKSSEILTSLLQICIEIINAWNKPQENLKKSLSLSELTELVEYEEFEDELQQAVSKHKRMRKLMHHYIPTNLFRARVRVYKFYGDKNGRGEIPRESFDSIYDMIDKYSPASFPGTPFSRVKIMNRAEEKTDTVMFAARDILRLEALSESKDEYSRNTAIRAQDSGQMAVFDPRQAAEGLALTCGNHCALKVGRGLCSSCRSMVSIPSGRLVYMEFSVTVSSSVTPELAIGFSPPDCPLNVMVGSWPNSLGLYSHGQFLVGSRWFPCLSDTSTFSSVITAGTTIGVLVHIPDKSMQCRAQSLTSDQQTSPSEHVKTVKSSFPKDIAPTRKKRKSQKSSDSPEEKGVSALVSGALSLVQYFAGFGGSLSPSDMNSEAFHNHPGDEIVEKSSLVNEDCLNCPTASVKHTLQDWDSYSSSSIDYGRGVSVVPADPVDNGGLMVIPLAVTADNSTSTEPKVQVQVNPTLQASLPKHSERKELPLILKYNINGIPLDFGDEATDAFTSFVEMNVPLYPTVSIISEGTKVWCRFCEEDIVYKTNLAAIGAPVGSRVYCLDGSLLMGEEEDCDIH